MKMTAEKLRGLGVALFGSAWQREMARELEINERAVRHYVAAKNPREIPDEMVPALDALVARKIKTLESWRAKLDA